MIFSTLIVTTVLGDVESATGTPLEPLERLKRASSGERRLGEDSKDARWKVGIGYQAGGNAEFYGDGGDGTAIQVSSGGNSKFYGEGAYPWQQQQQQQQPPTPWVSGGPRNPRWKVGIAHQAGGNAEFYGDGGDGTAILQSSGGNSKFYGEGAYPWQQQQQQQQWAVPDTTTAIAWPTPSWPTGNPSASASSSAWASAGRRRWEVGIGHQAGGNAEFYGDGGDGTAIKYSTGGNSKFYGEGTYPWQQQQQWMPPSPVDPPAPWASASPRNPRWNVGIAHQAGGNAQFYGDGGDGTAIKHTTGGNSQFYGEGAYPWQQQQQWAPPSPPMPPSPVNSPSMPPLGVPPSPVMPPMWPPNPLLATAHSTAVATGRRLSEAGSLEAPEIDNPVSCEDDEEC